MAYLGGKHSLSWRSLFLAFDIVLKFWERHGSKSPAARAIKRAEEWMLERTRYSDGLGAIYPPMMYSSWRSTFWATPGDHPDFIEAHDQFMRLLVDDGQRFFFQPCFSPVWDTAIVAFALARKRRGAGRSPAGTRPIGC